MYTNKYIVFPYLLRPGWCVQVSAQIVLFISFRSCRITKMQTQIARRRRERIMILFVCEE